MFHGVATPAKSFPTCLFKQKVKRERGRENDESAVYQAMHTYFVSSGRPIKPFD
jgi:hypothetical protein